MASHLFCFFEIYFFSSSLDPCGPQHHHHYHNFILTNSTVLVYATLARRPACKACKACVSNRDATLGRWIVRVIAKCTSGSTALNTRCNHWGKECTCQTVFFHVCFIGFYWNLCFLWSLKREIKWIRLSNKHEQLIIFSFFFLHRMKTWVAKATMRNNKQNSSYNIHSMKPYLGFRKWK